MFVNPTFVMKIGLYVYDLLAFDKKIHLGQKQKNPQSLSSVQRRSYREGAECKARGLEGSHGLL